jgi:alpha-ketoglutarate-dependent taurine dioxygenase
MVAQLGPRPGQRRAVSTGDGAAVLGEAGLPAEVRPDRLGVDLGAWAGNHRDEVRAWLHEHGALLFRGFGVTIDTFGTVFRALAGEPEQYVERSSPRTELADRVYSATDYPADQAIPLHNENSYQRQFPAVLGFCCLAEADTGGATPLAGTRRVLARIPADVVQRFAKTGVLYVRNFGGGLGLPWQEVFQTSSRSGVEQYCAERDIAVEWRAGDALRTRQVRPALARHPVTGQDLWFNHALFFNAISLPGELRAALLDQVGEEGLPNHTYYGDGAPIEPEVLDTLVDAYAAERTATPWRAGDVLLVDNLLAAHGREPFTGPRRVAVSMAVPTGWDEVMAA